MSDSENASKKPKTEATPKPATTAAARQQEQNLLDEIIAETHTPPPEPASRKPLSRQRGKRLTMVALLLVAAVYVALQVGNKVTPRSPIGVAPAVVETIFPPRLEARLRPTGHLVPLGGGAPSLPAPQRPSVPQITSSLHDQMTSDALFMTTASPAPTAVSGKQASARPAVALVSAAGPLVALSDLPLHMPPQQRPVVQPDFQSIEQGGIITLYSATPAIEPARGQQPSPRQDVRPKVAALAGSLTLPDLIPPVIQPHTQTTSTEGTLLTAKQMPPGGDVIMGRSPARLKPQLVALADPKTALSSRKRPLLAPQLGDLLENLTPPSPERVKASIATLIDRVLQPLHPLQAETTPLRVLAYNLTYRDQGVESEGTKHLSALVKAVAKGRKQIDVVTPDDVVRRHNARLQGEVWDRQQEVQVDLRLVDRHLGHTLSAASVTIPRDLLPEAVAFAPPQSESLTLVQQVVRLLHQVFPNGGDFRLGVWPDHGAEAVFVEGDKLVVHIAAETSAYLQVDYYQADGQVVHLLPNPLDRNFVNGGEPFVLGEPGSGYEFTVSAPFGEELLTVIASQHPLAVRPETPSVEPAAAYIDRLTRDLKAQNARGQVAGAHMIIVTKSR